MVIATSSLGVAGALREIGSPIAAGTFFRWRIEHPDLDDAYMRAKAMQTDYLADEMLDIADTTNCDAYIETLKDGTKVAKVDGEAISRSRLRVDTRKWIMAKLKPRQYGDKLDVTTNGENLGGTADASKEQRALELMKIVEHVEQRALSDRAKSLLE